jgi:transcription initiation factor TFIID subunit 3
VRFSRYLTRHKATDSTPALKNKYNKTGEDSRYQGTLLGNDADPQGITIVGGPVASIQEWNNLLRSQTVSPQLSGPESSAFSSAPLTPMDDAPGDE